jgi:hypothetical protein
MRDDSVEILVDAEPPTIVDRVPEHGRPAAA